MRNSSTSYDLVIGAKDMLRIREKIKHLYPNKIIVTAPCVSKLYSSKEMRVYDFDGKSSPTWSYFARGILSIIYDECYKDILLALFDENDVRLLWCLKWAKYITLKMTVSHFHVLNTDLDSSQHIGIFYDDKNVAELILNTLNILGNNFRNNCIDSENISHNNNKNQQTQKFRSNSCIEGGKKKTDNSSAKKRFSLPDVLRRKSSINKSKDKCEEEKEKLKTDSRILDTSHVSRFLRQNYYMQSSSLTSYEEYNIKNSKKINRIIPLERGGSLKTKNNENNENNKTKPFLLQRLSRTRSLIQTRVKSDISNYNLEEKESIPEPECYERKEKVSKTRSSPNTLILRDETMSYVINTAHVARSVRDKKHLLKNLKKENLESTDFCITDL